MGRPNVLSYSADFEITAGFLSAVLIFSSDFIGTVKGVAFSGANDAEVSFEDGTLAQSSILVKVSAGSVRVVTT